MWCCGISDDAKDDSNALQFEDCGEPRGSLIVDDAVASPNTSERSPRAPKRPEPRNPIMPQSGVTMQQCADKNGVLMYTPHFPELRFHILPMHSDAWRIHLLTLGRVADPPPSPCPSSTCGNTVPWVRKAFSGTRCRLLCYCCLVVIWSCQGSKKDLRALQSEFNHLLSGASNVMELLAGSRSVVPPPSCLSVRYRCQDGYCGTICKLVPHCGPCA